ncbi:hypothetical protein Vadar_031338 [Vaccinium darrowii]|uniref:Uncharacterized protein n=1 Tax=Vaccinium darrowii TaxID=229202 RepID=A0ACB7X5Y5_9ERIC|nr:hypothetical protein Vadar_031338 [Vaccinium darrowii]
MLMKLETIIGRNYFKIRFPGIGKILRSHDDTESDEIEQAIRQSIMAMINKREEKVMRGEESNYGKSETRRHCKIKDDKHDLK